MANMQAFRASIKDGLVRPNTFRVDLAFPAYVSGGTESSLLGQFHCKAASLPSSTVPHIPVAYQGRMINVAGEREFEPWNITVYNENFKIRDAFENWHNGINELSTNTGIVQPAQYQTDIYVTQLNRAGDAMKSVKLVNAMPIQVSPIMLDFEANGQVEMFEVAFVYDYYESSGVNAALTP